MNWTEDDLKQAMERMARNKQGKPLQTSQNRSILPKRPQTRQMHTPGQMNRTEAAYAQILELRKRAGDIRDWKFEAITLKLAKRTRYTPDFMIIFPSNRIEFIEIKGFMREDANVKLKVAAAMFPYFKFKLIRRINKEWDIKDVL